MKKLGMLHLPAKRKTKIFKSYSLDTICKTLTGYINGDITICSQPGHTQNRSQRKKKSKTPLGLHPKKSSCPKGYALVKIKTMLLDDIIIRDSMKNANPPRENKYQNRLLFYREHGTVYKTIQVDENGMLLDGYISYLILKEYGIGECNVEVMTRTSEKHCTERISTEKDGR